MRLVHLSLKNWRNFKSVDVDTQDRLFIIGPNASGKSNFLDALRFLRDMASVGGGFQKAIADRGGMSRVRSLAARNLNHGRVEVAADMVDQHSGTRWSYRLNFTAERRGTHRPILYSEQVFRDGVLVLNRPDDLDVEDAERLTQTALEQVTANKDFRDVADFFASIRYLHLVPQVIREPDRGIDRIDDPFGGDFLIRVAKTSEKTRVRRLAKVNKALQVAVPQLDELSLVSDVGGRAHLEARYQHWRERGARQDERDFSDGTLRLIGLLWSLLEGGRSSGPVLLEEPELSLHASVVQQLPTILSRVRRTGGPQVIVSTHSEDILADEGIGLDEVLVLQPGDEGTTAYLAAQVEDVGVLLDSGMSLNEILRPRTEPAAVSTLRLFND